MRKFRNASVCLTCLSRRWISHDKASLTKEAITNRVQSGLGDQVSFDPDKKVIETTEGSLPISPIFDPRFIQSRHRERKKPVEKGQPLNRFRRKLVNNTYAQALATPIRQCQTTQTVLPRYFMQDWEIVQHPDTGKAWFAPGPMAFEHVQPSVRAHEDEANGSDQDEVKPTNVEERENDAGSAYEASIQPNTTSPPQARPPRAPLTGYCINSQSLIQTISQRDMSSRLLGKRHGMAMDRKLRGAVWRPDMDGVLLDILRREATGALLSRSNRQREPWDKFIQPCGSWQEVGEVKRKMCVLWVPKQQHDGGSGPRASFRHATLDREGASYDRKIAVHNLAWLLGETQLERLREGSAMFRSSEILVLRHWNSHSMRKLHQLLWRLHGFLDVDT